MAKLFVLLIYFVIQGSIYADFDFSKKEDADVEVFYRKLATNLRSSSNDIESVFQKLATSIGRYQLEELDKINPTLRKYIEFDITLKFEYAEANIKSQNDSEKETQQTPLTNEDKIKDLKKAENATYLKIKPDNYFEKIEVEYNNKFFKSNLNYSFSRNSLDILLSRKILNTLSSIEYNTQSATLKTNMKKDINKDLMVNFSTITYINSREAFAGVNLRYGF